MYKSQGSRLSCLQGWMAARALALRDHREGAAAAERPAHTRHPCPGPAVCEAFAWTPELIHIRLGDAAQSGAAVPGCPTSIPFQEWSEESTGSGLLPSFLPHGQLQGIDCCSLAGFYRKARVNESLVSLSLPYPIPTLAKLPFLSLRPLLMMPGACFGKGTS